MKKSMIMSLCVMVAMALLYWAPEAGAYETTAGCDGCHGGFRSNPYESQVDGGSWNDDLHDVHRYDMLNGNEHCNACHKEGSKGSVNINQSIGENGFNLSCIGCHDGAGLKRKHTSDNGSNVCFVCHSDSVPDGENVLPPYYVALSIDPCNLDLSEDYAGGPYGLDNDGNGLYDGNDRECPVDNDGDGYTDDVDCNDNDAEINPDATEVCDGIDNNCDSNIDEGFDYDGDGYTTCNGDCNDNDSAINPDATEICDGIDNDCDGLTDDAGCNCTDGDKQSCGSNTGECLQGEKTCLSGQWSDCSGDVGPATETCDGKDNNCDGNIDDGFDNDRDGYTTCGGDCDDTDAAINPVATEMCDGKDNNCDGQVDERVSENTYFQDSDDDGYGDLHTSTQSCSQPSGYVTDSNDCDDSNAAVNPGAADAICDGVDNNCNGTADDGYQVKETTCGVGACAATGQRECQRGEEVDTCTAGTPQTEVCGDGVDQDCNGSDLICSGDVDGDGDGVTPNQGDCDDTDKTIHPGAAEVCGDGIDQDCSDGDLVCPEADVWLNSVKAPRTVRIGKRGVSKRILVFGSADNKVQDTNVTLSMSLMSTESEPVLIMSESIRKAVPIEGKDAKFLFGVGVDIVCKEFGAFGEEHSIVWDATISATENRNNGNDIAKATTKVICR